MYLLTRYYLGSKITTGTCENKGELENVTEEEQEDYARDDRLLCHQQIFTTGRIPWMATVWNGART